MPDETTPTPAGEGKEHRITDMRIIAWSLVVTAFGTLWIAFQITLMAADL